MAKRITKRVAAAAKVSVIEEIHFASWEQFKNKISQHLFPREMFRRGKYLFRGHSDPTWRLIPTFDRMFKGQSRSKRLEIADDLLIHFKRALEGFTVPPEARASDSMLLALGQHYGLPTRMLDWTESPYIAAFFAYNRTALWGARDQQVVIWVLDSENPIWSTHYGVEIIDVPSFGNQRIRNQSGKFTLSKTPFPALEDYVHAHGDRGALTRYSLPASESTRALADLDAMGIHHATVYPEIEGAAQMALFRTVAKFDAFVQTEGTRPT
jgi:hypothetical protein